jgi:hypothetical protein
MVEVIAATGPKGQSARLTDPGFDAATRAVLEAPLPAAVAPLSLRSPSDQVAVTQYGADAVDIRAQSATPGVLILSGELFAGWEVTVDGQPASIVRTDYGRAASICLPARTRSTASTAPARRGPAGSRDQWQRAADLAEPAERPARR